MTIRSLLEHVGDCLVDPAPPTANGALMKTQLAIPAVESIVRRHAFRPPTLDQFAHATVQAYDQSLANTGVVLIKSNELGLHLLATAMIRPPADVLEIPSTEGNYARADSILAGVRQHRSGFASSADAVVYERTPVKGQRIESILLAGREVHRATEGRAVMMDNRHAKKVLLGRAGTKANPVTKAHVKEMVEAYLTPPREQGKNMPWNEHVRDACMLALAWLLDEKQRQVAEAAQAEPLAVAA
ncbi:hypothetical protein [Streptomyces griseoaurantiacus]|uniref:hypothetical protein n=1 Tax=Streptomyces griseoaurantiacus TaxID=68213 RepID=UPI0036ABE1D1